VAEHKDLLQAWLSRGWYEDAAWETAVPGPPLDEVMRRLSSVPAPFLGTRVDVRALAADMGIADLACVPFVEDPQVRRGAAMGLWLLASQVTEGPHEPPLNAQWAARTVDGLALRVAPVSDPLQWVADAHRREEAARYALLTMGYVPAGEATDYARGVFATLDSLAHSRVLAQALADQRHRDAVAAKLAAADAKEAAARYSRE